MTKHLFWKDGEPGGMGGFFFRSELHQQLKVMTAAGLNVVGIVIEEGSFNIEFIVERNDAYITRYEQEKPEAKSSDPYQF